MESLPPIPTPVAQRWREFRIQILPLIVFVAILVAVVFLWKNYVTPTAIVGQVQTNTVSLTASIGGLLTGVSVEQFQDVKAGDVLASITPFDPEVTTAMVAAVEADIKVIQARMGVNEVQSLDAGFKLGLDLLEQRTFLAVAKVKLEEAQKILDRSTGLLNLNIVAQAQYDVLKANRDVAQAEVTERTKLVEEWAAQSAVLAPRRMDSVTNTGSLIEQDILRKQEEIRQLHKPVLLRAPIDGRVSSIAHPSGVSVIAGATILTITPTNATKIVGYVRQPITYRPRIGDAVVVSTRSNQRRSGNAQVIRVAAQLETVGLFLVPSDRPMLEQALPIAVSLPLELNLLPGEFVDLHIAPAKN